ncbi:hypothetical protein LCGC14_0460960 [marine sediment metagenome]|uniref:Uncharacterized protein n=1 Tax=marine sediment metagenome TaxID=412755 RepID=A0A0F9SK85_9ZZZZ
MTHTEFTDQMNKLLIFYRNPPKGAEEHYWKALHLTSAATFEKACDLILNTHKFLSFPLIPIFHECIAQVSKESGSSDQLLLSHNCPTCRGIGLTLINDEKGRNIAHPCSCSKGLIYKSSFGRVRSAAKRQQQEMISRHEEPAQSGDPY